MDKEILYQGNSTITVETHPDYDHPVVIKKPSNRQPSQQNLQILENEYQMTHALNTVEGVRKVLGQQSIDNQPALILEYIDGQPLRETIEKNGLDLRLRLEIALDLARILGEIHQLNVIHLDLNNMNILIGKDPQAVHIIDLGAASHIDRSGHQKVRPDQLLGTLPYIAPEQTGRINRAVDERSDLYSLGVVLYELMTGQLPFDSHDPLEIVHDHIARVPISPSEESAEVPKVLSIIILKLLSKNAEDRYQSAAGIQSDLEKCLQHLSPENTIEEFPLGEADYSSRLRFPQKLYGRDRELKEIESAFEKASQEASSIMFVAGFSGTGKTALVEEIQQPVSEKRGYFIEGKFDQYLRTTPYSAIIQAFAEFVSLVLAEQEKSFDEWQDRIQSAVGNLGQVMTDAIPPLEKLIGAQPDVPQFGGQEGENRFNYVFINFLLTIATEEHPLVLFIDDIQWIDSASLRLLKVIQSEFDQPGLLVIGAYRDNEVDARHPLMEFLDNQELTGLPIRKLKLENLQPLHVETFLSDTLRSSEGIPDLGTTVFDKTHGNPFFMRRWLFSLNEEGHFRYATETNSWQWDLEDVDSAAITDNVADLLAKTITQLPGETRNILSLAACIGNRFELSTMAQLSGLGEDEVSAILTTSLSEQYVYISGNSYEFVHDQVYQAAYTMLDAKSRTKKHLEIGRLLLGNTDESALEEQIFDVVAHYNLGANLLTDPAERLELVRLNLVAGRKAKLAAAFVASADYLKQGLALLGEGAWRDHYRLTLDIHSTLIEVCYVNTQYEEVEALFDAINENAKQDVDTGVAHKALIDSCIARHELGRGISLAEGYLARLDVTLDSERESDLPIAELRDLPPMDNREKLAAMEILMAISATVVVSVPERFPSVVFAMLNLISRYGNNNISSFAYTQYAMVLCIMQQYQEGNRFGQLALDLLEKYPQPGREAEIMNMQYGNVRHWIHLIHDQITPLMTHHRIAMQAGSIEFAFYCLLNYTWLSWGSGKPLEQCLADTERAIRLCQSKNQQFSLQMSLLLAQSVLNLTGRSPSTTHLEGKWFSEETMMAQLEGNQFVLSTYGLLKMKLGYLFGDPGAAYRQIQDVLKHRGSVNPHYLYTKISFYGALSCIAGLLDGESDADRQERLDILRLFEEELKLWAEIAPMNYQHQYDLVMAEKCRVSNKPWEAVQLYEQAIRGAQENQFIQDQALTNELIGKFWLEQGNDTIAEIYMREARALYHKWGADAKVDHLEECYPQWFQTESISISKPDIPDDASKIQTTITDQITPIQLDIESITNATQILAAETDLDQLCTKMMSLVMANSGAEKAVLLLKRENEWFVQARKDITTNEPTALFHQPFDPADGETELIPESIFNYCQRTSDALVLGDAQLDQRFVEDWMIKEHQIQSIACFPALSQGQLRAMLYLENSQTADVFTLENIGLLKHLSAQFAISVENALLYDNLNQLVKERTAILQQEIAERKNAEADLQAQINLFDKLLETVPDTIEIFNPDTMSYIKWNQACIEVTGYSDEEFAAMNPAASFFHADVRRIEAGVDQALREGNVIVAADVIAKDGGRIPMEFMGSIARDAVGNPLYFISIGRNITERKKAEEALRDSEEKYRDLVEKVSDVIYSVDVEGVITYLNPAIEDLLGLPPERIIGQQFAQFVHPEDLGRMQNNIQGLLSGNAPDSAEYKVLTNKGETRLILVTSQPIMDGDHVTGLQGVLTDITERKEMENRLEEQAAITERERLARRLHDAVTQTLFSASVIAESTPRIMENDPDLAKRNLEQLSSMLRGSLAEMRTMLIELRPEALIGKPIGELIRTLSEASQTRINCPVDLVIDDQGNPPEEVTIVFYRVAQEAFSNIIKYAEASEVSINLTCDKDAVLMIVKDNGRGFEPETVPHGHFGLNIMVERFEQIDGELTIDSKPGQGTQITAKWSELSEEKNHA